MGGWRILFGKSSQNSPILVYHLGSIPCVFCLYIIQYTGMLLKVVSNNMILSVLSMSVINGFSQKIVSRGLGSIHFFLVACFNIAKPLTYSHI